MIRIWKKAFCAFNLMRIWEIPVLDGMSYEVWEKLPWAGLEVGAEEAQENWETEAEVKVSSDARDAASKVLEFCNSKDLVARTKRLALNLSTNWKLVLKIGLWTWKHAKCHQISTENQLSIKVLSNSSNESHFLRINR